MKYFKKKKNIAVLVHFERKYGNFSYLKRKKKMILVCMLVTCFVPIV